MSIEYWMIDEQRLDTYAFNISTLTGRSGVPTLRGEDLQVAYRPGKVWRPKVPDSRTLSLAMWVIGCDPETGAVAYGEAASRAQFNENWQYLRRLFYRRNRQLTVKKAQQFNSGLRVVSAKGELAGTMEPDMFGPTGGRFVVDLFLADPFFYGDEISTEDIPAGDSIVEVNGGDDMVLNMKVQFHGPLSNPTLRNLSIFPEISLSYLGDIDDGDYVELNTDLFSAELDHLGAKTNVIALVDHVGSHYWMALDRDDNTLELEADAGDGHAKILYRGVYH